MVNVVNGNQKSLSVLLQQKQKKLDSIKEQKQAVQDALNKENDKIANAQVDLGNKKISLSEAIVALQNHPFKGMKAPDAGDVKYEIKCDKEGKSLGIDQNKFDRDMAEFKKAEAEYKALEAKVDKTTKDVKLGDTAVKELTAIAQAKEEELKAKDAAYEVTMGDIESLNKQIDEAAINVTLSDDKNNDTLVEETVNQLKDLQKQGLVGKNIDLDNLNPKQLKNLSAAVVNTDIKKRTVAASTALDGMSKEYTNMSPGKVREYSVADMQEMAKALGADAENDEAGFAITSDDLKGLKAPEDDFVEILDGNKSTVRNQKQEIANGGIVFPRGIKWQGTEGNKLSDFGITDNGDGTYKTETGKIYTASEVNKWFREVEDSSGNNYSKYLDKAEKLGIDYNQFSSSKELKEAVKAAEKEAKAAEKQAKAEKKAKKQASVVADLNAYISAGKTESKKDTSPKVKDEKKGSIDLNALLNSHNVNKAELKIIKAEGELDKAKADLRLSKDFDEYLVKQEVVEDKEKKLADARNTRSELTPSSSTFTAVDNFLNDNSFEEGENVDERFSAGINIAFRNGANVSGVTEDGTSFAGKQIISGSGTKAYLINGEYYGLSSDGLPDLSKKLNKAEFEK